MALSNPQIGFFPDLRSGKYDGRITACKQCSGIHCCGILEEGGNLEPPYLTKLDIAKIQYFTGLQKEKFAFQRINPITGNLIYKMRTKPNHGCIFFDYEKGTCEIFSYRPMDCRLFPLDIEFIQDTYYWALFKYGCNISQNDLDHLLNYKDVALKILGNELHDYATSPVPGMSRIGYQLLMKVDDSRADI